jgi:hypothetical protein
MAFDKVGASCANRGAAYAEIEKLWDSYGLWIFHEEIIFI